jgi:hypothetical protein
METQSFVKQSFVHRLKDTRFLIKNSFKIIWKNKDIKTPLIRMIVLSIIINVFLYVFILIFLLKDRELLGTLGLLLLFITLFILVPFRFFYDVRKKAEQSWIVYNTICGKDINYHQAHEHTKSQKSKLRMIAFVDIIVKYANGQRGNKKGILWGLISIFLSFLNEVWDLLSHYMLPAVVIEQKPLKDIIPEIKALKNNVPATLVGVFGIDFVGNVIKSLFFLIMFIGFVNAIVIWYFIRDWTPEALITIESFSFSFSRIPVFIELFLISIIGLIYRKIVESIKVIYFTIFYTSIMRPMDIPQEIKVNLTNYLLMNKQPASDQQNSDQKQQHIQKLSEYIEQYKKNGYSEQQIKQFLISKWHLEPNIDLAIKYATWPKN